jgi:hypothetical protein
VIRLTVLKKRPAKDGMEQYQTNYPVVLRLVKKAQLKNAKSQKMRDAEIRTWTSDEEAISLSASALSIRVS